MFTTDLRRNLAALACTIVFSTLCIAGAVAPAETNGSTAVVVARTFA